MYSLPTHVKYKLLYQSLTPSNRQYNEPVIVALLREGNQKAFEELHRRFAPALLRKLLHLVPDKQQAEDLLQDSFVSIWLNFHQFDPGRGRLFTWMARIVRNNALTHLRLAWSAHEPLADSLLEEIGGDTPTYYWIGVDYWVQSTLSPHQSHLIHLLYYQGYTHQEASDELGLPLGTVKTRVRRALQRLRSSEAADEIRRG